MQRPRVGSGGQGYSKLREWGTAHSRHPVWAGASWAPPSPSALTPQEHTGQGKRRWPVRTGAFWPSFTCPRGRSPSPQIKFHGEWGGVCFMGMPPSPSTCGMTGKGFWHLPDCWSAFWCSVYLMPRHGLLISHGMLAYLGPELSQIQQSRIHVLGIIGMCTGIAFPCQILSSNPSPLTWGRKIAGYHSTTAASICMKPRDPTPLQN